jgi:DNA polymerase-4
VAIARQIKQRVASELSLVASVGVAPTKFVAKIASDIDKPDGLRAVSADS